jgi:hypothetical protein
MSEAPKPFCFVVMGFGKKTDHEYGRVFDLDATYQEIIKPAVESCGLKCVRGDEILRAGAIDTEMYQLLLRADLVVADISTSNPNAIYELGIRHALRPRTTIIMSENQGRFHFDLSHMRTFRYKHLGEDIGAKEARRAINELSALIVSLMSEKTIDSPVYTFLPDLVAPTISEERIEEIIEGAEELEAVLSEVMYKGDEAMKQNRFEEAQAAFREARALRPNDTNIVQKLVLVDSA